MSSPRAATGRAVVPPALISAVLAALFLVAGCTSGTSQPPASSAGLAGLSAEQILSRADTAARAAGSVHFSSTTRQGSSSIVFSDDSAAGGGRQDITISGGGQMTVLLVSGVGYVNGNVAALTGFLGLSAATAAQLAGQWISFSSSSPGYAQVADGVTTGSVLGEITPVGTLTKTASRTVDGQRLIGVRGPAPASAQMPKGSTITLYVAATGRPLPVTCLEGTGRNQTDITLSHWGEQVSVSAPQTSVPVPAPTPPAGPPGVA
jgi:hypothetical protein